MGDAKERPQNANLTPIQPGQVLNPEGINQYSYRKAFEGSMTKLLQAPLGELLEFVPESVKPHIPEDASAAEVIALMQLVGTLEGSEKPFAASLERIWPKVERHEHTGVDGEPMAIASEPAWHQLSGRMAGITTRQDAARDAADDAGASEGETLQ